MASQGRFSASRRRRLEPGLDGLHADRDRACCPDRAEAPRYWRCRPNDCNVSPDDECPSEDVEEAADAIPHLVVTALEGEPGGLSLELPPCLLEFPGKAKQIVLRSASTQHSIECCLQRDLESIDGCIGQPEISEEPALSGEEEPQGGEILADLPGSLPWLPASLVAQPRHVPSGFTEHLVTAEEVESAKRERASQQLPSSLVSSPDRCLPVEIMGS